MMTISHTFYLFPSFLDTPVIIKYTHTTNSLDSLIHTNSEELAKSLPVISYPAKNQSTHLPQTKQLDANSFMHPLKNARNQLLCKHRDEIRGAIKCRNQGTVSALVLTLARWQSHGSLCKCESEMWNNLMQDFPQRDQFL